LALYRMDRGDSNSPTGRHALSGDRTLDVRIKFPKNLDLF
jgi:hypothetical protein